MIHIDVSVYMLYCCQCQATVVGLLSSLLTVCLVLVSENHFSLNDTLLLCACSTLTASIASFILGNQTIYSLCCYFRLRNALDVSKHFSLS